MKLRPRGLTGSFEAFAEPSKGLYLNRAGASPWDFFFSDLLLGIATNMMVDFAEANQQTRVNKQKGSWNRPRSSGWPGKSG